MAALLQDASPSTLEARDTDLAIAGEEWREVPGSDNRYEVSNLGRVRSWCRTGRKTGRAKTPALLAFWSDDGYDRVVLRMPTGRKRRLVSHLVAEAFIGPRPDGQVVRHRDGNPRDNRPANLQYGTQAQNAADTVAHGRSTRGERHALAVLTGGDVVKIRARKAAGETARQIAPDFGVSHWTIYSVVTGKTWGHVA